MRSQRRAPIAPAGTDPHGRASLSFPPPRTASTRFASPLANSQLAPFTLDVFLPTPAVNPPGPRLPAGGASGQVDRIQNINAAYSVVMRTGVSYLINLANKTEHAASAAACSPRHHSFEEGLYARCCIWLRRLPAVHARPGQGGRYSIQRHRRRLLAGVQRFRLQAAPPARRTAPGLALGNYADARGRLDGGGVRVLRLYRLDVASFTPTSRSSWRARLGRFQPAAPQSERS